MNIARNTLIQELISCLLAVLFVYAAVSKLIAYNNFKLQLSQSPYITQFAGIIAWCLPALEIMVAIVFAIKTWRIYALYASLFLLSMFTFYLIAMLQFSYYIPCSCGGILSGLSWRGHILFNVFFIGLSVYGIYLAAMKSMQRKFQETR